ATLLLAEGIGGGLLCIGERLDDGRQRLDRVVSRWQRLGGPRRREALAALHRQWKQFGFAALGTVGSYSLTLLAMRLAPVGYVAVLRESSVVIAAFIGWKLLGERDHRRRISGAVVVLVGLVALVAGG
ncbi:MAG: EamA family transporter, partial [Ilumatobacteraceae bacterium]